MPIHRIEQLTGLELNSVNGVNQSPDRLFNLVNDRFGGYIPYGVAAAIAEVAPGFLIGWDTTGKSSFNDNTSNSYFALFNGVDTPTTSTVAIPSAKAVHLPGAGGFSRRDAFYLYGFDSSGADKIWTPPASTEYTDITIEEIEGNLPEGPYYIMTVTFFNTLAGSVCVGYTSPERTIFTADEKGLKVTAPTMGDGLYMNVYIIAPDQGPPLSLYPAIFTGTLQSGEDTEIKELPLLRSIGSYGSFILVSFKKNPVSHQGSLFGQLSELPERYSKRGANIDLSQLDIDTTMVWTDPGWANLASPRNFIKFTPTQSTKITGYVSTPGSMLVFMENEAYRLVGTSNRDFTVQPFPVPIGCDENLDPEGGRNMSDPVLLGSTPFVIWNGKLFAVDFGNVAEVSKPVWLPDDPFVEIGVDIRTTDLVIRSSADKVYRFNPEYQHWSDNVISGDPVDTNPSDTATADGDNPGDGRWHFMSHPDADGIRYITFDKDTDATPPAEPAADPDEDIEPVPAIVEEEPAEDGRDGDDGQDGNDAPPVAPVEPEHPPTVIDAPANPLLEIGSLMFDFDPDYIPGVNGDAVSAWPDATGNFPNAIQANSAFSPTLVIDNSLPVTYPVGTVSSASYDPENPSEACLITTSAAHGFNTGDRVIIASATGNTAINGTWYAGVTSTTEMYIYSGLVGNAQAGNGVLGGTPTIAPYRPRHLKFVNSAMVGPPGIINALDGAGGFSIAGVIKTRGSEDAAHDMLVSILSPLSDSQVPVYLGYGGAPSHATTGWQAHTGRFWTAMSPREGDSGLWQYNGSSWESLEDFFTTAVGTPTSDTWRVFVASYDFSTPEYLVRTGSTTDTGTAGVTLQLFSGNTLSLNDFSKLGFAIGGLDSDNDNFRDENFGSQTLVNSMAFNGNFARLIGYRKALTSAEAITIADELTSRYL